MSTQFQRVIPPVVTPRHADGSVDTDSLKNLTRHLLDGGVSGLFVLGSSGEVPYLSNAERELVVDTIAAENAAPGAASVPLIVGANEQTTNRVIEEARKVIDLGADAIVVTSMYYAIGNAEETETHFRAIHDAVSVPIFAYDVPVRTHFKLPTDLLVRLGRTAEAMAYARQTFAVAGEALELAKGLREAGWHDEALAIAELGLGLGGNRDDDGWPADSSVVALAHWARDYAGSIGRTELALTAAIRPGRYTASSYLLAC